MVKIIKAVWRTVKKFLDVWSDRRLAVYSAQAAYYMFVSLLPFCALMFVIIKAFPKGNASLTSKAMDLLPGLLGNVLAEAYHEAGYYSAAAVIPITAILTLWTASKGMHALSEGLKSAYGSAGSAGIKRRLVSVLYTLVFILAIILSLSLLVFGNAIIGFLIKLVPGIARFALVIKAVRSVLVLAIITLFFILAYRFLPGKRHRFKHILPGAAISGIGWTVLSYGYSLYIDYYVSSGNSLYGSLTAAVLLMFWLNACISVTLAGGLVNSYFINLHAHSLS